MPLITGVSVRAVPEPGAVLQRAVRGRGGRRRGLQQLPRAAESPAQHGHRGGQRGEPLPVAGHGDE